MNINQLLSGIRFKEIQTGSEEEITNIAYDSRKVKKGALFVCQSGGNYDSHNFINEALEKGAVALIVEREIEIPNSEITVIKVENSRKALSGISSNFYNHPSHSLNVIGITGTNGKTSISYLVSEILQSNKETVGVIGTIGMEVNNVPLNLEKTTPTTPDSLELQMILGEMRKVNVSTVAMEVTSIGLDQHRVDDCQINIGVFTNLTEDHLDFHGTMENYKNSKRELFKLCEVGVINIDDLIGREYVQTMRERKQKNEKVKVTTYGIDTEADLKAFDLHLSPSGSKFKVKYLGNTYDVAINLPGKFNVYNALAAIGATLNSGVSMEGIIKALRNIRGAKGRFESVQSKSSFSVVVDYAHTPDALENVLTTAKEFKPKRLITVFGCGGDRDKSKRSLMGRIAGDLSDFTIITSDNPRTEHPMGIISNIEEGITKTTGLYEIVDDRKDAIKKAIEIASAGDIVIIAGKGHETYQILNDRTIHFDDMEIVKELIS
ncbi:UDP-N-acetylmuramoyl-L-alanyl-D-glutamate--2,6-diaminopimelate ligase [Priestia megaterium]|uniref:UDP-N-acetylmuramoyl-L-alanyl-D-glutamate--2, 6-diaminopimelate ligase n=1 Tax=Priestia megaterium TaxID=1404 RepID=UPI0035D64D9C